MPVTGLAKVCGALAWVPALTGAPVSCLTSVVGAGVGAAVDGAAVVVQHQRDDRLTGLPGGGDEEQVTGGVEDRRDGEQGGVRVPRDEEVQRLAGLVGRAGRDVGRPVGEEGGP